VRGLVNSGMARPHWRGDEYGFSPRGGKKHGGKRRTQPRMLGHSLSRNEGNIKGKGGALLNDVEGKLEKTRCKQNGVWRGAQIYRHKKTAIKKALYVKPKTKKGRRRGKGSRRWQLTSGEE